MADVLGSAVVMGGFLLGDTVFIQPARDWHGYTIAVSNREASTARISPDAAPSDASRSGPLRRFRFILGVVLLVGAIAGLIDITTITGLFMVAGIVAFFVLVYLSLVAATHHA